MIIVVAIMIIMLLLCFPFPVSKTDIVEFVPVLEMFH